MNFLITRLASSGFLVVIVMHISLGIFVFCIFFIFVVRRSRHISGKIDRVSAIRPRPHFIVHFDNEFVHFDLMREKWIDELGENFEFSCKYDRET